jgi:hypothetical protein
MSPEEIDFSNRLATGYGYWFFHCVAATWVADIGSEERKIPETK